MARSELSPWRREQLPRFLRRSDLGRDAECNAGMRLPQGDHLNELLACFTVRSPPELLLGSATLPARIHPPGARRAQTRVPNTCGRARGNRYGWEPARSSTSGGLAGGSSPLAEAARGCGCQRSGIPTFLPPHSPQRAADTAWTGRTGPCSKSGPIVPGYGSGWRQPYPPPPASLSASLSAGTEPAPAGAPVHGPGSSVVRGWEVNSFKSLSSRWKRSIKREGVRAQKQDLRKEGCNSTLREAK